jgi:uncharacterized membrane protein YkvA (DUF1232 family)
MRLFRVFAAAWTSLPRVLPLFRDARVPVALKALAVVCGILIVSPIDIFSDIPVLGALDDAALLTMGAVWFVRLAARHVEPIPVRA